MEKNNFHFFLGGKDLEMEAIKALLTEQKLPFTDGKLAWGASTSQYGDEIEKISKSGKTPVLIELSQDSKIPENSVIIDHHNENANKPASILQVCALLDIEPTRKMQLIAANDSGYIPAMQKLGASQEEIDTIRLLDRKCQGITDEQEKEAERAIANKKVQDGVTIIKMSHSKTATVADRLFDSHKQQNLLVLSDDGEVNYFGDGKLCEMLKGKAIGTRPASWDPSQTETIYDNFGGWTGGTGLGKEEGSAFWGGYPDHKAVTDFILKYNREKNARNIAKMKTERSNSGK